MGKLWQVTTAVERVPFTYYSSAEGQREQVVRMGTPESPTPSCGISYTVGAYEYSMHTTLNRVLTQAIVACVPSLLPVY